MIDHCIAVFQKKAEFKALVTYLTDGIMAIAHNTAGLRDGGQEMRTRWAELNAPKEEEPNGDEIVADILKRANLRMKE